MVISFVIRHSILIISRLCSDEWVTNDNKVRVFEKKLRASGPIFQYFLVNIKE